MKIGIFDSGLGGLHIATSVRERLPNYDYIYLGDTMHVPYGKRSKEVLYDLTLSCVVSLFEQNCALIIVACNTASAAALRSIQQDYLPHSPYKDRRVLGVVVPMIEEAIDSGAQNIGLIATNYIVNSNIYEQELIKINPNITIHSQATPLLVPLLEDGGEPWLEDVLSTYLAPLLAKNIDSLILGCTHYGLLTPILSEILPKNVKVLAQNNIIPSKLAKYIDNHPEIDHKMTRNGKIIYKFTDLSQKYIQNVKNIVGNNAKIRKITI